jgi:hypothetical protein
MSGEINSDRFNEEYFRKLATHFQDHPDWEYAQHWKTLDEAVEEAAEYVESPSMVEIEFRHVDSDGLLYIQMPNEESTQAVSGYSRNTILGEPWGTQSPDPFHEDLAAAYQKIAENHQTDYVISSTSSHISFNLSGLGVPWEYDDNKLDTALDTLSNSMQEAEELNKAIKTPIEALLND